MGERPLNEPPAEPPPSLPRELRPAAPQAREAEPENIEKRVQKLAEKFFDYAGLVPQQHPELPKQRSFIISNPGGRIRYNVDIFLNIGEKSGRTILFSRRTSEAQTDVLTITCDERGWVEVRFGIHGYAENVMGYYKPLALATGQGELPPAGKDKANLDKILPKLEKFEEILRNQLKAMGIRIADERVPAGQPPKPLPTAEAYEEF